MNGVRGTLAALGAGLLAQRAMQLVALLALARTLGTEATGRFAQGIAFGGMLAVIANAGLRNATARGVAREPHAAGSWLGLAVRARLARSGWLVGIASAAAAIWTDAPWFWAICALQTVPLAFDLKHLGDAASRAGREVVVETMATAAFLAAVLGWLAAGRSDVTELAAIQLASRGLYAVAAAATIRAMPAGPVPPLRELLREARSVAPAQVAGELGAAADAWLAARLGGDEVAGLYAVAARIAGAASMPSAQLARLFFAHQLHAANGGDPARATRVALRSLALILFPLVGGGIFVADDLCALFGPGFAAAGPALGFLLVAVTAQHLGWQGHQALLALGRDREFARALWVPALLHLPAMAALTPWLGATGAAAAAALAQFGFGSAALLALGPRALLPATWLLAPILLGLATAAGAFAGGELGLEPRLLPQLGLGALAFALGLWRAELHRGWRRLGAGLTQASGFRS